MSEPRNDLAEVWRNCYGAANMIGTAADAADDIRPYLDSSRIGEQRFADALINALHDYDRRNPITPRQVAWVLRNVARAAEDRDTETESQ